MPNAFDDNTADMDTASGSSPENDSIEDSELVSEDANTPDDSDDFTEDDDEATDDLEPEDDAGAENSARKDSIPSPVPFHKNPRFRQLNSRVKDLEAQLAAERAARSEAERLSRATPEEKAVHELSHKYGFVQKDDIAKVEKAIAALKDEQDFKAFLEKHPEAASKTEALKALAYTPNYIRSTYEEIYKDIFAGETSGDSKGGRKVVARRTRAGMRPISSGAASSDKGSGHIYTRAELVKMDDKTYEKNRKEIQKQMREGLIK